jgi:triacylglycerol lipase
MPVVIFVHGGGYVGGDKNKYGPIYGNVAAFFARNGMLGVNATYRLAPRDPWPAGGDDVGRMVAWAKANAKTFGGDANRIYLFGHSAGATHVASYVFDASLQPKSGVGVAGAILLSGLYRVTEKDTAPNIKAYFGEDASKYAARSSVSHVNESKVPLFIATAEYDPVFLGTPSYELASLVCLRDGKCPRFIWLKGHNHISEAASFDTGDRELGRAIVDFIHAGK